MGASGVLVCIRYCELHRYAGVRIRGASMTKLAAELAEFGYGFSS
jgi:hypothetical protein